MNHKLWATVGARVVALSFVLGGLAACDNRLSDNASSKPPSTAASPSSVVVGQAPAAPTGDPPGTTPVAPNTTEISKQEESKEKPHEGDNHSYSTLSPNSPQKAEGKDPMQERSTSQ